MIEFITGDLLQANAEALVNTVNCVGIMGKGLALQFKEVFPENYQRYRRACEQGTLRPGQMFVHAANEIIGPKFIINFPTKRHWRDKSLIQDIESGLDNLVEVVRENRIKSLALPPLGCGNGGLDWNVVRELIERKLQPIENVDVIVYQPTGAPASSGIRV